MKQVLSAIRAVAGNDDVKDAIVNAGTTDLIVLAISHHLANPQVRAGVGDEVPTGLGTESRFGLYNTAVLSWLVWRTCDNEQLVLRADTFYVWLLNGCS